MNLINLYYIKKYNSTGKILGDALSYSFIGQISGFDSLVKQFIKLETQIIKLGYVPRNLNDFIEAGGYGKSLDPLKKIKELDNIEQIIQDNKDIIEESRLRQGSKNTIIKKLCE